MDWKDFSTRNGHVLAHYLDLLDEADQARRIRTELAGRLRKAPFVAPLLAALGRALVRWGTWLRKRYDEARSDAVKRMKEQQ